MKNFLEYLTLLESLKKDKKYDKAWEIANQGVSDLLLQKDDSWYAMYYQMADILARETKWEQALFQMSFFVYFHSGLGGITHEKFVKRLLKKIDKEHIFEDFVRVSLKNSPKESGNKIKELIDN